MTIWRTLCENWRLFAGTPVRYWLEDSLARVFGLELTPSAQTADELYDALAERLAQPQFRPRELLASFGVEVLATTDDPADTLEHHDALAALAELSTRVIPTLRADAYMTPTRRDWPERLEKLAVASGIDCGTYRGLLDALREPARVLQAPRRDRHRRRRRRRLGHPAQRRAGRAHPRTRAGRRAHRQGGRRLPPQHAVPVRADGGRGRAGDAAPPRACCATTTRPSFERFGPDTGHDIPGLTTFAEPLRAAAEPRRHQPRLPDRAVHHRRDRVLARDRTARRLLPERLHRRALVVPRRTRRGAPLPGGGRPRRPASTRPPASSTTRARCARSRRATT